MKNTGLTIRVDKNLKNDFAEFCEKSGISVSAAINQLAVASINKGKIPFVISMVDYDRKNKSSKDITRVLVRIKDDLKSGFAKVCKDSGISMATVIKMFMLQCVGNGKFPFE